MLTKKDRQLLIQDMKEVFATKDELQAMEQRQDKKYVSKVDLDKVATEIKKGQKDIVNFLDKEHLKLEKRVTKIEKHIGLAALT